MILFSKKSEKKTYDRSNQKPVIKASICNGEQVAGFKDIHTGKFEEVMLIRRAEDLEMSNANIDELNGQAVLDLIMGRLGRKDSAVEHWKGSFRTDR